VSRPGLIPLNRFEVLVLMGILSVLVAARPARASGCHVADRPVLGAALSWEQDQRLNLGVSAGPRAPHVLTHLPCPGELPDRLVISVLNADLACLSTDGRGPLALSESLRDPHQIERIEPLGCRLDRPPRAFRAPVSIGRSAGNGPGR